MLHSERKSKPKKAIVAVITRLAMGLLQYVFAQQVLRNAQQDTVTSQRLDGVRVALHRAIRKVKAA